MPFLKPFAILVGFLTAATIGTSIADPASSRLAQDAVRQSGCAAPQVSCRYGYVPDPATGCPTDVCAPKSEGVSAPQTEQTPSAAAACPALADVQCGESEEQYKYTTPEGCTLVGCRPKGSGDQNQGQGQDQWQGQDQGQGDERCKADMLRNLTRWEKDLFRGFDQQMRNLRSNKVQIPAELTAAITGLRQQFAAAKSAGSCQEMNDANNAINDAVQPLMEQIQTLEQAANDARCVKDSLRGIKDLERRPLKDMDRKLKALEKQRIAPPADIVSALAKIRELIAQAKQATTCQDISELNQEVFGMWNDLQEKFMILDMLAQAPRMIKQIDRELKNIDRQWAQAVRRARVSKADLSDAIAKGDRIIATLHALFEEFKAIVAAGDFERLQEMDERGQEADEKREELFQIMNTIQALSNIPREISNLSRRANDLRRLAREMGRRGSDASELLSCLDGFVPAIDTIKRLAAQKPVDIDQLADAIQTGEDAMGQCQDLADELIGKRGVLEDAFGGGFNGGAPRAQKPVESAR